MVGSWWLYTGVSAQRRNTDIHLHSLPLCKWCLYHLRTLSSGRQLLDAVFDCQPLELAKTNLFSLKLTQFTILCHWPHPPKSKLTLKIRKVGCRYSLVVECLFVMCPTLGSRPTPEDKTKNRESFRCYWEETTGNRETGGWSNRGEPHAIT